VIGWDPANGSGQALRYSERNWGRRWMVEDAGIGWWIQIRPTN
jgi:hypothetical protein